MEAVWVLLLIFQTADGVDVDHIDFATRDLCVGAKTFLVENIKLTAGEPFGSVQGFCIQTRRNTP